MELFMTAETSPFDANPEQTPPVTKQETKNQFHSSEGPVEMVENATVFRADYREKNIKKIPVHLFPVDSWQNFEDAYIKGQTNDHLHYILEQMGVANKLEKGVFQLKLSIHLMPHCDTETGEWIPPMKEILNRIWDVYLEELDVKPLAEKIGEKTLDNTSRRENAEFLLKRLFGSKGINAGLKILKEFCAAEYTYIMEEINNIMGKRAEDESLLGQELFTAAITMDINMTESTGDLKMNIVVEDPKLHFGTVEDARKAVFSADDHKIIGALLGIDCDTTKENEEDADKEGSSANIHMIVAIDLDSEYDTTKEKATRGEKQHQYVLNRCLPELVKYVDFGNVSMYIQQKEILDFVTLRDISEQKTTSDKIKELIKQIQQRDQVTYEMFKECLVQAKQEFLKVMLEEEEAKYAKEIKEKQHMKMKRIMDDDEKRHLKRKRIMDDDETPSSVPS